MSGVDDQQSTDEQTVDEPGPTVADRLRSAGLSDATIQQRYRAGSIRLDGKMVTDLDQPAPPPTRPVIAPA
jgi:hypothetical protein